MKKHISILLAVYMLFALTACASGTAATNPSTDEASTQTTVPSVSNEADATDSVETHSQPDEQTSTDESKILIAFFSRADENYGVGVVEKGNTQIIAEMIADETGGDLFHIERDTPYLADYDACTDEAKAEQNSNARPTLQEDIDISTYDVIYLGYPNWWGDMPMPVYTFLEGHDFTGKTVIPFCTHAGSGLSGTVTSIESTTGATVLDGLAIPGTTAQNNQDEARGEVIDWLNGMK